MKNSYQKMSQNLFRTPIVLRLTTEKNSCIILRLLTPALIMAFACAIGVTVLHHHEDGEPHSDCALCLLLIQPAVANNVGGTAASMFLALPENPPLAVSSLTPLYFRTKTYARAPPPLYN